MIEYITSWLADDNHMIYGLILWLMVAMIMLQKSDDAEERSRVDGCGWSNIQKKKRRIKER